MEEKLVKARQVKAGMMSELLAGKIRLVWVFGERLYNLWLSFCNHKLSEIFNQEGHTMEYVKILETSTEIGSIKLDLEFRYMKAFEIYDHFVDPELLRRWWVPQVDKIDFRSGGEYQFTWTKTQRRIWGKYSDKSIGGKYLEFTWQDTLSPEIMPKSVSLVVENVFKDDAVCFGTLTHSSFNSSSEDQAYRSIILSQWKTLFQQLANQWGER